MAIRIFLAAAPWRGRQLNISHPSGVSSMEPDSPPNPARPLRSDLPPKCPAQPRLWPPQSTTAPSRRSETRWSPPRSPSGTETPSLPKASFLELPRSLLPDTLPVQSRMKSKANGARSRPLHPQVPQCDPPSVTHRMLSPIEGSFHHGNFLRFSGPTASVRLASTWKVCCK